MCNIFHAFPPIKHYSFGSISVVKRTFSLSLSLSLSLNCTRRQEVEWCSPLDPDIIKEKMITNIKFWIFPLIQFWLPPIILSWKQYYLYVQESYFNTIQPTKMVLLWLPPCAALTIWPYNFLFEGAKWGIKTDGFTKKMKDDETKVTNTHEWHLQQSKTLKYLNYVKHLEGLCLEGENHKRFYSFVYFYYSVFNRISSRPQVGGL